MSSSVFERTRALHADIEEMREALLDKLNATAQTAQDRILLDHELKQMLDELLHSEAKLLEMYDDADGARASDLAAMSGAGDALWTTFYETLAATRMYHAKFPNAGRILAQRESKSQEDGDASEEGVSASPLEDVGSSVGRTHFTAEEAFGGRVDMHALFERYINLPQFSRTTDYLTFLGSFHSFATVPREKKIKAQREEYRKWLTAVRDYLVDFHARIRPLVDVEVMRRMIADDFEQRWNDKQIPGWFGGVETNEADAAATAAAADSAAAATAATADSTAATATASNPLYCVACAKLFAKTSVFDAHLPGKKHKKNEEILKALAASSEQTTTATTTTTTTTTTNGASTTDTLAKLTAECRSLALLEDEIHQFALILSDQLSATIDHLQKKQTRTYEEIAAESAAQQEEITRAKLAAKEGVRDAAEEEEEDSHKPVYNPLNLPLDFDGKPIPYWKYKLDGLNLKFDCEICGNFTYLGPRDFERHFTEWRHAYGMRALGIPNTKHFAHITKMDAALALFEKLKKDGVGAGWRPDEEEEFEDADGNVFSKKVYLELQKQGLV